MSLRARVVLSIALVFLLGLGAGAGLAGLHARASIRSELEAGLSGGQQTVRSALEQLPASRQPQRDLRELVATFDGNRHVRATLWDAQGRLTAVSRPFSPAPPSPGWFSRMMRTDLASIRISAPAGAGPASILVLDAAPADDVGDVWVEFSDVVGALAVVCVAGFALIYLTIGGALRPLRDLTQSFERIGSGDYRARVDEDGASELVQLSRGFNSMAGRLAAMETRNRALEEQLLTLQDEERADLARDLHDEIGPYLFAVSMDAGLVGQLAKGLTEIQERVKSIQAAVGHMQGQVRDILGRLRPTRAVELGLNAAIEDTVEFWRARHADIDFDIHLLEDESLVEEAQQETLYRVVQESLNNAVRHGRPSRIAVRVELQGAQVTTTVSDDGTSQDAPTIGGGMGLVGMRERVVASGGSLSVQQGAGGRGWTVTARLPASSRKRTPA